MVNTCASVDSPELAGDRSLRTVESFNLPPLYDIILIEPSATLRLICCVTFSQNMIP